MNHRIHILGGSGSGTSTLARGLATALHSQAFDADDFYWQPNDPPFQEARPARDRARLMEEVFLPRRDWVLAGSLGDWGAVITPRLTQAFFLSVPRDMRLERLRRRETERAGPELRQSARWKASNRGFLEWAAGYDDPAFPGRSRASHERWLALLDCPVIRLDAGQPAEVVLCDAVAALRRHHTHA